MLRASPAAVRRLAPEVEDVVLRFFNALPSAASNLFASVLLYGPQARRYEPGEPFSLLVVLEARTLAARAALTLATDAATAGGLHAVEVTATTLEEMAQSTAGRLVSSARREGVLLWERVAGPAAGAGG
jgi:hypothetical protein